MLARRGARGGTLLKRSNRSGMWRLASVASEITRALFFNLLLTGFPLWALSGFRAVAIFGTLPSLVFGKFWLLYYSVQSLGNAHPPILPRRRLWGGKNTLGEVTDPTIWEDLRIFPLGGTPP